MNDPHLHQQLGPYLLRRAVGRGGMGAVYAATDADGQLVAVKLLSPILATDESFRDRFTSEIESLKKLNHPNIVQLLAYGEQDGQLFYAMDLIDGTSLQEELRHGRRFDWREVSEIAIQVCAALKHAHDHGIIHRDLKPANLLYTKTDHVKLLDFGIAKLFGNTALTTGNVMGTVDYMAPEQADGQSVGPRSDLYSLGCVMYALLAGRPPFTGKSVPEVIHKVQFESPIPVNRVANEVPEELEHIIDQLLSKKAHDRIPTALAVSHRLRAMNHALTIAQEAVDEDTDTAITLENYSSHRRMVTPNQETVCLDEGVDVNEISVSTDDVQPDRSDHFTLVDDDRREYGLVIPWQTIGSLLLLFVIAFGGYFLVRWSTKPVSANTLYQRIATSRHDPQALVSAERDIENFLQNYPDDPRASEIRSWQADITLYKQQRTLTRKARRQNTEANSVLESLYLDILRELPTNPHDASRKLEALVGIYDNEMPSDPHDQRIIELATQQLQQLDDQIKDEASRGISFITERLSAAAAIESSNPEHARRIREHLVELFGDQPWAEECLAPVHSSSPSP